MRYRFAALCALYLALGAGAARATIHGEVRGIVHDPDHRPIAGARVSIHDRTSSWTTSVESNAEGEFEFSSVSAGEYMVWVEAPGFKPAAQGVTVNSTPSSILHFMLEIKPVEQSVVVTDHAGQAQTEAVPTATFIEHDQISRTPGAARAKSLAAITDYVPGAVVSHDTLHVHGGHQLSWALNGVPVPNTSIASNFGPEFDPRDVDVLEVETGGDSADFGERTYAVFNVVPRSGFEFNREGEAAVSYGNFNQSDNHVSFGSHTDRFAYYASVNANRSNFGLTTPVPEVIHGSESGVGGFTSLMLNASPSDQLRLVASVRGDHDQVPNTPDQQAAGIRDLDLERDAFLNLSWEHTIAQGLTVTVSPFYRRNRADYLGGGADPLPFNDNRLSQYQGIETDLSVVRGKHTALVSAEAYGQRDDTFVSIAPPGAAAAVEKTRPRGDFESFILHDRYQAAPWLSLGGGVQASRNGGPLSETAFDPQAGAALRLPNLGWVLHGSYARSYLPPPLETVSGPLLQLAAQQGFSFLPLEGERDEERQFGLTAPLGGWTLDADTFYIKARNFFDHDALGNSNVFLPLTIQGARIYGWETTLRSPAVLGRMKWRAAFSHQTAEGFGAVTGGLTDFSPPEQGYFFLDHDQRNTLSAVGQFTLPRRAWAAVTVAYGSGFLNGDGPDHLRAHTTFDFAFGKSFGESWTVSLNALNVADSRFPIDKSNTFGGTHYASPREIFGEVHWRFKY